MARLRVVAKIGLDNPALPAYVLFSVLAHLLFIAIMLFSPSLRGQRRVIEEDFFVDLVAPAASPAPPAAVSAPSEPAAPPEQVRVETRAPVEAAPLPENPKPEKKPPRKSESPPPPPRSSSTSAPATTDPSPDGAADPGPEGSVVALEGIDVAFAWYAGSVKNRLYGTWRRPILARVDEPYEVTVAFDILRDGRVSNLRIEASSGVPSMDRSALRAVSDASPLPPLPAGWRDSVLPAAFVFRLYPD